VHVLTFHGVPQVRSERWQRLCLAMAAYPADEQEHLHIQSGTANVPILR
jgi:hypothetical protein